MLTQLTATWKHHNYPVEACARTVRISDTALTGRGSGDRAVTVAFYSKNRYRFCHDCRTIGAFEFDFAVDDYLDSAFG